MLMGKVVGMLVSTRKETSIEGLRLMLVRAVNEEGRESGSHVVAADVVGAGPGEMVLVAQGSSARQTKLTDHRPIDAVIMAIVDSWSIDGATKYRKYEQVDESDYS